MTFIDWFVKFIFLFWLMIFGVAFTDAVLDLQDKTDRPEIFVPLPMLMTN